MAFNVSKRKAKEMLAKELLDSQANEACSIKIETSELDGNFNGKKRVRKSRAQYRIKQTAYGNWNGYLGSKKQVEFGTDENEANVWLEKMNGIVPENIADGTQETTLEEKVNSKISQLANALDSKQVETRSVEHLCQATQRRGENLFVLFAAKGARWSDRQRITLCDSHVAKQVSHGHSVNIISTSVQDCVLCQFDKTAKRIVVTPNNSGNLSDIDRKLIKEGLL